MGQNETDDDLNLALAKIRLVRRISDFKDCAHWSFLCDIADRKKTTSINNALNEVVRALSALEKSK